MTEMFQLPELELPCVCERAHGAWCWSLSWIARGSSYVPKASLTSEQVTTLVVLNVVPTISFSCEYGREEEVAVAALIAQYGVGSHLGDGEGWILGPR